jgi:hypothetical protein
VPDQILGLDEEALTVTVQRESAEALVPAG